MMFLCRVTLLCTYLFGISFGQFPNVFQYMNPMNDGGGVSPGNTTGGSRCPSMTSCPPWCGQSVGSNGCPACKCNSPNLNMQSLISGPQNGINPLSGLTGMMGNMNPMAGGMSPMNRPPSMTAAAAGGGNAQMGNTQMGGAQTQQAQIAVPGCDPIPRTCPAPQPWCERLTLTDGCVKCLCGNDLAAYFQSLQAKSTTSTAGNLTTTRTPDVSNTSTTPAPHDNTVSTATVTDSSTNAVLTTPSHMMSCLDNFFCVKMCDHGYKTADNDCPLCECNEEVTPGTAAGDSGPFIGQNRQSGQTTLGPIKLTSESHVTDHVTNHVTAGADHVIRCPGIFDCALICENGYRTDVNQCPLCQCEVTII